MCFEWKVHKRTGHLPLATPAPATPSLGEQEAEKDTQASGLDQMQDHNGGTETKKEQPGK